MNMKKKVISVILALVMTASVALVGCGGSAGGGGGGGKATAETLQIGVENKGYGDKFAHKLAEAFEAKTGIDTMVVKSNSSDWTETALLAGPKNNDIDVIFDINNLAMKNLATAYYVDGYERAYADLSDLYNAPLEGYNTDKTLKELVYPYSLSACTWGGADKGYGDGKQYFVNWASGVEGIVYNKALFAQYNLSVPKTTAEMFALMDQMKTLGNGTYAKNADGYEIYPFSYSGKVNYLHYPQMVWWAQYDGIDTFNNILQGKDANGNYTAESQKTIGKLSSFGIVADMLATENGYADPNSLSYSFTDAQVFFLAEQAFMMSTGDWLEREMSTNFEGNMDIAFMPIPVNSDIIANCTSITSDAQLSEVISYIDGEIAEKPAYVNDADLAYVKSARSMYCSEGNQHICYIPAYSNNVDAAKQFIQFMLSKEGQEIMLEYSYGNMAMLNVDTAQFDYYAKLSNLQKSKLSVTKDATYVGKNYVHPMYYAGGMEVCYNVMEMSFGVEQKSGSYKTAKQFWENEYAQVASRFDTMIAQAGVSN